MDDELRVEKITHHLNEVIRGLKDTDPKFKAGEISDGYHTFNELYGYRKAYNALLFNEWAKHISEVSVEKGGIVTKRRPKYDVHKSKKHSDGQPCFDGTYFVVIAMLPDGQVSNHYKMKYWDDFQVPEEPQAKYEYDGHTSEQALERLEELLLPF